MHTTGPQHNQAASQRIAGRDYHETTWACAPSLRTYLLLTPTRQIDEASCQNGNLFRHRFGIEAATVVRRQVIAIRQRHDFSDRQVRWLIRSGLLKATTSAVELRSPGWWMWTAGYYNLMALVSLTGLLILQIQFVGAPVGEQLLGQAVLAGIGAAGVWWNHNLHLQPCRWIAGLSSEPLAECPESLHGG